MARIGSTKIATAFSNGKAARTNNTYTDGQEVRLHGNRIMWKEGGEVRFSMCGWCSVVTKDRLNHLFNALDIPLRAYQRNLEPHVWNYDTKKEYKISSRLAYSIADFI